MKKFVAFAVAAVVAAGSTVAMAQCQSCQQNQVFAQPVYSAPVYSAPIASAPVYAAPVQSEVVYNAPMAIESAPMSYEAAPMSYEAAPMSYDAAPVASNCCCGGGMVQGDMSYGGGVVSGDMSYGGEQTLTVGSVINGETVVSVGESVVTSTTEGESTEGSGSKNLIEGSVEPTSDGGEVVAPPAEEDGEVTPPAPDEA